MSSRVSGVFVGVSGWVLEGVRRYGHSLLESVSQGTLEWVYQRGY